MCVEENMLCIDRIKIFYFVIQSPRLLTLRIIIFYGHTTEWLTFL